MTAVLLQHLPPEPLLDDEPPLVRAEVDPGSGVAVGELVMGLLHGIVNRGVMLRLVIILGLITVVCGPVRLVCGLVRLVCGLVRLISGLVRLIGRFVGLVAVSRFVFGLVGVVGVRLGLVAVRGFFVAVAVVRLLIDVLLVVVVGFVAAVGLEHVEGVVVRGMYGLAQ